MSRKSVVSMRERFLFFGRNSSIHGLNHLFKINVTFLVRLFWLIIIVISAGCVYLLLVPVIKLDGGINFTPDTLYVNWTTTFPGVTVCDMYSSSAAATVTQKLKEGYPELLKPMSFDQIRHTIDLLHGRGRCTPRRCVPCGSLVPCDVPWRAVVDHVHKKCEQLLADCSYLGQEISCCKVFHMVDSEYGPCYSFNTLQNANFLKEPLFTANRSTGPPALTFRLISNSKVSIHSTEELSTNYGATYPFQYYVSGYQESEILFSMVEMVNDPMVEHQDIAQRECRFPHEVPRDMFHTYPVYSYGACVLAKSVEHSYEHCHCISPVRDLSYQNYYCNYTGMNCLAEHDAQMNVGLEVAEDDGDSECLPSCVETELFIIHDKRTSPPDSKDRGKGNLVTVKMSSLPTLRYQRNVLRTDLDFVVSVGGMAGLFFSASVLSAVEIFYLMMRTPSKSEQ